MSPQILGNLTAVAQQIKQANQAAQTAQQMAANAQETASTATSAILSLQAPTLTPVLTSPTSSLLTSGAEISWQTLQVAQFAPAASWVLLSGYAYFSSPDNADVELDFRRDGADASARCACKFRSVNGNYSGEAAINIFVPVSRQGTIDYQIINGSFTNLSVDVVAYA